MQCPICREPTTYDPAHDHSTRCPSCGAVFILPGHAIPIDEPPPPSPWTLVHTDAEGFRATKPWRSAALIFLLGVLLSTFAFVTVVFVSRAEFGSLPVLGIALLLFFTMVFFLPNALGHPDNYIMANPLSTPAHIVPEWYFWPFYAILRAFTVDLSFFGLFTIVEAKLLGVIAMFASILILFFLPWLDNSPVRSGNYRPKFKIAFWVLVADVLVLGFCGQMPAEEPWVMLSQLAAAYYFAHFLIVLPLISHFEKPLPLPGSITEAVLQKHNIKGEREALPGMGSDTQPQPAE